MSLPGETEHPGIETVIAARREENRFIISWEMPLISNPCPSSRATCAALS